MQLKVKWILNPDLSLGSSTNFSLVLFINELKELNVLIKIYYVCLYISYSLYYILYHISYAHYIFFFFFC